MEALRAIDAKDADALLESGDDIFNACERCHNQYWYVTPVEITQAR
jgi:hypothetical protein